MRNSNIIPKLILVEGLPGSGKTTTAQFIESYLKDKGIPTQLFLEGNLDNPADYDAVACLDQKQMDSLLKELNENDQSLVNEIAVPYANDYLIYYWVEKQKRGDLFSNKLLNRIADFDIYNGLPLEKHQQLLLARWKEFVQQKNDDATIILDCSFMQNPMCKFLIQHNAAKERIVDHIRQLEEITTSLNPLMIYLARSNVRETIETVSKERSPQWLDSVIQYHTEQDYGTANNLSGFDGYISALEDRKAIELDICNQLAMPTVIVDQSDWDERLHNISAFLEKLF